MIRLTFYTLPLGAAGGFLRSFSKQELFAHPEEVDEAWLAMLEEGSRDLETCWAVLSFLAGLWRHDYHHQLESLALPVLTLFGEQASGISISRDGRAERPEQKAATYAERLPLADSRLLPGRNVLPWESAEESGRAVISWLEGVIDRRHTT